MLSVKNEGLIRCRENSEFRNHAGTTTSPVWFRRPASGRIRALGGRRRSAARARRREVSARGRRRLPARTRLRGRRHAAGDDQSDSRHHNAAPARGSMRRRSLHAWTAGAAAVAILLAADASAQPLVTPVRVGAPDAPISPSAWAQQDYSHLAARPAIADAFHDVFGQWAGTHRDVQLRVSVMPALEQHKAKLLVSALRGDRAHGAGAPRRGHLPGDLATTPACHWGHGLGGEDPESGARRRLARGPERVRAPVVDRTSRAGNRPADVGARPARGGRGPATRGRRRAAAGVRLRVAVPGRRARGRRSVVSESSSCSGCR